MLIDTSFDFRTDAGRTAAGKQRDPDLYSRKLRECHQLLWSKALPSGHVFKLDDTVRRPFLRHRSELGDFHLTSDGIIATFTQRKRLSHITKQFTDEENEEFSAKSYTIGGMLVFPGNQIDRMRTINGHRGCDRKIEDRFDLTLECIRRHYVGGEGSPLEDLLFRYRKFFALFDSFEGYVDFFMLQDLVDADASRVRFFLPLNDFNTPLPWDRDSYKEYRERSMEFVGARNRRIEQYDKDVLCKVPLSWNSVQMKAVHFESDARGYRQARLWPEDSAPGHQ